MTAREAIARYAKNRCRHDLCAEKQHHPVDRTRELGLTTPPPHPFRNRQGIERGLHDARQEVPVRAPGCVH